MKLFNKKQPFNSGYANPLNDNDVYINGLGFIQQNEKAKETSEIKKASLIIGLSIILFWIFQMLLVLPVTHLFYILGLDVTINQSTGLILVSPIVKNLIDVTVYFICFLLITTILLKVYNNPFKIRSLMKFSGSEVIKVAAPQCIAMGLLGMTMGKAFVSSMGLINIVVPNETVKISGDVNNIVVSLLVTLAAIPIMQELLFRGVILHLLRRFGDDFALIVTSVIFCITRNRPEEIISTFFLGLVIGYFVIRTNSVLTALILRLVYNGYITINIIVRDFVSPDISFIILSALQVVVIIIAIFSYISLVRNDRKVFTIIRDKSNLKLKEKVLAYSFTLASIFLVITSIINCMQRMKFLKL